MKKILAIILSLALALTLIAGCGQTGEPEEEPQETQETQEEPGPDNVETEEPEEEPEERFEFQTKVSSVFLEEIFGKEMVETWYNVVDAALSGEDTFDCPYQKTYDWVMGQFAERCFPVLRELIEIEYGYEVKDGKGHIVYKTSREEFDRKISEFGTMVEDILNKAMKPGYSDMEKALGLYRYFYENYVYDYETFEKMENESVDYLSVYRFLTGGTGVCQEISMAYSYLLCQVGVDATIMMGENHAWSYVRINGNEYHIDPTFVLSSPGYLYYFMMTDFKRSEDFSPDTFIICSNYTQEYEPPMYAAADDSFLEIWDTYLDDFDPEADTISCRGFNEESYEYDIPKEFSYEGF